jgi:hypothetical protein
MMKNKVQIMGAGLLALLLVFAGCSNPLGEKPDASPEAVSGGKIVVTLGGLDARTLGPMAEDVAGLKYRLVLVNTSKVIEEDITDFPQPVERSIEAGEWTVAVLAYTDGNETAWGYETKVQVVVGETRPVALTLLPVTNRDAAGTFDYAVDFPAPTKDFDYESTTLKLTPVSDSNSAPDGEIVINLRDPKKDEALLELPAGKYSLDITLTSTRQIAGKALKVTVTEVVYLYPGLTTQAHYAFELTDFDAEVYLKGKAEVNNQTEKGTDGMPLVNYIPKKVQLKLYDDPLWDDPQEADITLKGGYYEWELLVPSEQINGAGNANQVQLRLVIESDQTAPQTLTSDRQIVSVSDIQGNSNVSLTTSVYDVVKETGDVYFSGIKGVSGIAHDKHAIAGMPVELKIVPAANYGVRGTEISVSGGASDYKLASDGTVSFTMPAGSGVTVNADFFHLQGTAVIAGSNTDGYKVTRVEALGDIRNENTSTWDWVTIGATTSIAADDGSWTITDFEDYVYNGQGSIQFKVYMEAADKAPKDYTTSVSVSSLTGTLTVALSTTL